jgi:peptidyl-prolyl cis-trans isomerase A (cyclophilin A)
MIAMLLRFATALLTLLAVTPAPALMAAPGPSSDPQVVLHMAEGDIVLALDPVHAPLTTANFLRYIDQKRLDGITFYRTMNLGDGIGLIQGGARGDPKRVLPPVGHEPTTQTGLSHGEGTISMARYEPGSATSDFFITASAMPSLDADPAQTGDNAGFAAFGHVVSGMDMVKRILHASTSPTEGEGVMKGQMLTPPVIILTARRIGQAAISPRPAR